MVCHVLPHKHTAFPFVYTSVKARLLAVLLFSVPLCLLSTLKLVVPFFCMGVCLAFWAVWYVPDLRKPVRHALFSVNIFCLFLWLTLPLVFVPAGEKGVGILFVLGPVGFSQHGVLFALLITLKANTAMLFLSCLLGNVPVAALAEALQSLHVPEKLVLLLLLTHSNLGLWSREVKKIWQSARLRGFVPKNSWHTYTTTASLLGMLFVLAWEKSQRVEQAMRLRGFNGSFPILFEELTTQKSRVGMLLLALLPFFSWCFLFVEIWG